MNAVNQSVFKDITTRTNPSDYWLNKKLPENQGQQTLGASQTPDQFIKNIKIITPEEARKTNNVKIIGLSIAGATVATAAAVFALVRGGGSRKILQFSNQLKLYFEKQLEKAKISGKEHDLLDKAYISGIKLVDKMAIKSEAVNNFTTFKDLLFEKIMRLTKFTGKIHREIGKTFERIGRHSVISQYANAEDRIISAQTTSHRTLRQAISVNADNIVEINGIQLSRKEWAKRIKAQDSEIQNLFEEHFTTNALKKRYYSIKQISTKLKNNLSKLKTFFSRDVYNKFIADSKIVEGRETLQNEVWAKRRLLSYTQPEMIKSAENSLYNITKLTQAGDKTSISYIKSLKHDMKEYVQKPAARKELKNKILETIRELSTSVKENKDGFITKENGEKMVAELEKMTQTLTNFKQGKVQDILEIYKNLLPEKEYKVVERYYTQGIKSLDKSIKIETEDFVNKLRDLTLGAAPTDMLSMITSIGTLGYYLGRADDNDKRTSIALKYGIPALAAVGVPLYCNAKLFNGSKSLIITSIATFVVNRIGTYADNKVKNLKAAKAKLQQNA